MLAVGVVFALRHIERWLHQHIFKVGWLLMRSFETTTVLYYTFFLPGIVLHQFILWMAAGILNVRAERSITLPEKQEIGELRLNFVRLSPKANAIKTSIIHLVPFPVGLLVVWYIANNILVVDSVLAVMSSGNLSDIVGAINQLTRIPDFWLWVYILFCISNTMMPEVRLYKSGWNRLAGLLFLIFVPLFLIGIGDEIVGSVLLPSMLNVLNTLSSILLVIMAFDLFAVGVLGTIEAILERVTGASATFVKGKMIVMSREEVIQRRKQQLQRERNRREKKRKAAKVKRSGPPSVYHLEFPVPGPPGTEPVTSHATNVIEADEESPALRSGMKERPHRDEPAIIAGYATLKLSDDTPDRNAPFQPTDILRNDNASSTAKTDEQNAPVQSTEIADGETDIASINTETTDRAADENVHDEEANKSEHRLHSSPSQPGTPATLRPDSEPVTRSVKPSSGEKTSLTSRLEAMRTKQQTEAHKEQVESDDQEGLTYEDIEDSP